MIKYFIRYIKKYWVMFLCFLIMTFIIYVIELAVPYIFSKFIDDITVNKNINTIYISSALILALVIIYLFFSFYKEVIFNKCAGKVRFDMLDDCESHIEKLPIKDINKFNPAYLNERLNNDILNIILFIFNNLCNSIIKIIGVIILGGIIATINVKIFLIMVIVALFNGLGFSFYNKELFKVGYDYREANNKFYGANNDRLNMMKQTKINSWFDVVKVKVSNYYTILLGVSIDYSKVSAKLRNIGYLSKYLSLILLIIFGGYEFINDNLTIGEFILVYNYTNICMNNMEFFLSLGQNYQHAKVCYNRMSEILTLKEEINGTKIINAIDSIEVKDLYFGHNSEKMLYEGLNLTFKKGNIYCIKGENGSGKSTLIDILTGIRYDYRGEVLYNNNNLRSLDANYLRKNLISVVEQEPDMINISLKENLVYGLEDYDNKRLEDLCEGLYLDNRVKFNDNDTNLSGGEKQKISEIRALLKRPKVIILDEPISALDANSIVKLKHILNEEKKDKIIILVTHNEELYSIIDNFITLDNVGI
ncbi:ATP-binding cassette domain-containing protein [Clostridium hydrogeniformans]|uniref:ATP-binding cassette domain-containing protein n=1 Tax=Clostridium hydrogeniformans TaxID=349933 RepID=UPI000486D731|nr:ABC transporter ATP-binding protein [Clostridium hydrogeniformans]